MATDLRTLPAYLADDATFRTWGSGINAQLAVVGLVQTSDTGQINWASVARPGTISTYAGYEIWRFADSLQATKPVFVKLEYGVAGAVDRPLLRMTVATATNGAGTLSGQVSAVGTAVPNGSKTAGATLPSYCSGSSSRVNLATHLDTGSANFAHTFLVERVKTADGVETGDAIVFFKVGNSTSQSVFQVIPFSGTIPTGANIDNMAATLQSSAGISSVGSYVALSPTVAPFGKTYFASWCAYQLADLTAVQPFTANHLGATRTFMPLGAGVASTSLVQGNKTGQALAILWE